MSGWVVRVPGSTANLGPGFDALGMALTVHAEVSSAPFAGAEAVDEHHLAMVAFRRSGGRGSLHVRANIPMGKGLGYSGAVRLGGIIAAQLQAGELDRSAALALATELEGHADNVAASLFGGVVAVADGRAVRLPMMLEPSVLVWVPPTRTSTDTSRASLPQRFDLPDVVHAVGHTALLVAALAAGDVEALRVACVDRLHQPTRLEAAPGSATALRAALVAGAWAAWLSGSGPSVAVVCDPAEAERIAAVLPVEGHVKQLRIDADGVVAQPR